MSIFSFAKTYSVAGKFDPLIQCAIDQQPFGSDHPPYILDCCGMKVCKRVIEINGTTCPNKDCKQQFTIVILNVRLLKIIEVVKDLQNLVKFSESLGAVVHLVKKFDPLIKCPIDLKPFGPDHSPHILPCCGITICKEAIQDARGTCPDKNCKKKFTMEIFDLRLLRIIEVVKQLQDLVKFSESLEEEKKKWILKI